MVAALRRDAAEKKQLLRVTGSSLDELHHLLVVDAPVAPGEETVVVARLEVIVVSSEGLTGARRPFYSWLCPSTSSAGNENQVAHLHRGAISTPHSVRPTAGSRSESAKARS